MASGTRAEPIRADPSPADAFPAGAMAALARRLPAYARLAWRLGRHPRLGRGRRAAVMGGAAYLVSPIDLVPGIIPLAGQLDDAAVALLALRFALHGLPVQERRRELARLGLDDRDLDADLATVRRAAAWLGRRGARLGMRAAAAAARAVARIGRRATRMAGERAP